MEISAVVLSFNSKVYIEKCVRELITSYEESQLSGEVIVIDNGSIDGSVEILKLLQQEFKQQLVVIYLKENTGTTYSRNLGLKKSKGDYIVILDSDAYMNASTLRGMKDWLANNPSYGLVSPQLTFPDGRFQLSVDTFPTFTRKLQRFFMLKKMEATQTMDLTQPRDIDYAISACWMFPRRIYDALGGLDENIFYSPEDVDYCLRIWAAGNRIAYLPQFSMVHDAQEISRGFKINKFTLLHVKGLMYYFLKHRYCFGLNRLYKKINRLS